MVLIENKVLGWAFFLFVSFALPIVMLFTSHRQSLSLWAEVLQSTYLQMYQQCKWRDPVKDGPENKGEFLILLKEGIITPCQ